MNTFYLYLGSNINIKLNNGIEIPKIGLGVYQSPPGETTFRVVKYALEIGYRHIDTAKIYGNESDVGKAVKESKIPREEIFVTTKLWNSDQGFDQTIRAFDNSLQHLDLSYVDLYLIHWPVKGKLIETWKAMVKILKEGKARAIGVSNYSIDELKETIQSSDILPAVNQIEYHPFLHQKELFNFCKRNRIQIEAYSPLTRGKRLNNISIIKMAKKYNKTSAQILIKWCIQQDIVAIPKSIHQNRILENIKVFDFEIEEKDMETLNKLNENLRTIFLD
jgi:diketogulonate reductase-like aldo/keto reductase